MTEFPSSIRYTPKIIDIDDEKNVYRIIIDLVGTNKKVLEIGTSTGYVSELLKKRNNLITGIEIDPEAAEIARQHCEQMIIGDIEQIDLDEYLDRYSFDVVVCADVLEHLRNPEAVLEKLHKYLAPDGYLVVSLPNTCHGDVILRLLHGDFKYTSTGLLDETHLRFFGLKNIVQLFNTKGYCISELNTTNQGIGLTELKMESDEKSELLNKFIASMPHTSVYQYIFKAKVSSCIQENIVQEINVDRIFDEVIATAFVDKYAGKFENELEKKDIHIRNLENIIDKNQIEIEDRDKKIISLETNLKIRIKELNSIHNSLIWSSLIRYQKLIDRTLPSSTRRRNFYDLGLASIRLILRNGIRAFFDRVWERYNNQHLDSSNLPVLETNIGSHNIPLPLTKMLSGLFVSPADDFDEIRILTATYNRKNSDLELQIFNSDKQVVRIINVKGYRIKDNDYTCFKFKPIKNSKDQTFSFKLVSMGEPSAMVWYDESESSINLQLKQDNEILKGSIGFQVFADTIKSKYDLWIIRNEPKSSDFEQYKREIQEFHYQPLISIIVPVYNPEVAWIRDAIESVRKQVYENWELCIADASTKPDIVECLKCYSEKDPRIKVKFLTENKGISGNSNEALALANGEFIGLLDHDDELSSDALYEIVKYLQNKDDVDMIYTDEDKIDPDGKRSEPFFKPDWSPDMLMSCMYTCHFSVYKKKIIDDIGGFRSAYDGSQDYDLALRTIEKTNSIHHIPKVLYHWRTVQTSTAGDPNAKNYAYVAAKEALTDYMERNNIRGHVNYGFWRGSYRLNRELLANPLVSIIIPTKDHPAVLKTCIDSILKFTKYDNYEIIIVNNNSVKEETYRYFEEIRTIENIKVLDYPKPYNFSALNNYAVKKAGGEFILFLNDDTEVIVEEWLMSLLKEAQRKEVGAVGCKLLYPNDTIQHAGVILGIGIHKVAGHSHKHLSKCDPGYAGRVQVIHNVSAVTGACLMMRKEVFEEIDGFDEKNFAVAFNDVDLCLKIREKGYLIVYTPYAELYHHESLTRGYEDTPEKEERFLKEVAHMRQKWGEIIDAGDPYYSVNLTLGWEDFSINI